MGEDATRAPSRLVLVDPPDAVLAPAGHFQHMDHGMTRPNIIFVDGDGTPARRLRFAIAPILLEREGMTAEDIAETRNVLRPSRHDPACGIPHARQIADVEMQKMHQAEGQDIVGMVDQDLFPDGVGSPQVALRPGGERSHMGLFARGRRAGLRPRGGQTLFRAGKQIRLCR